MMFLDKNLYPVDETLDGGDSARAIGIIKLFNVPVQVGNPADYELGNGELVRHPTQSPWENPGNFSRDQLMCLVPALPPTIARRVLKATIFRFFFAQNFERDAHGTVKYPWPHMVQGQLRWFDFADPLFPVHISHLVTCAKADALKFVHIFGWPMLALQCIFNSTAIDVEQNQLQCIVKTAGNWAVKLYKKYNPAWVAQTRYYWDRRNQPEIADAIIANL